MTEVGIKKAIKYKNHSLIMTFCVYVRVKCKSTSKYSVSSFQLLADSTKRLLFTRPLLLNVNFQSLSVS